MPGKQFARRVNSASTETTISVHGRVGRAANRHRRFARTGFTRCEESSGWANDRFAYCLSLATYCLLNF